MMSDIARSLRLHAAAACSVAGDAMEEYSTGNETFVNGTPSLGTSTVSTDERRGCALYEFIMYGVVQLVITVVGLVGKFRA